MIDGTHLANDHSNKGPDDNSNLGQENLSILREKYLLLKTYGEAELGNYRQYSDSGHGVDVE